MNDLDLLRIERAVLFVFDKKGRMVSQNDPNRLPPPKMHILGCTHGNICTLRSDVPEDVAGRILELFAGEPPLEGLPPVHAATYAAWLVDGEAEPISGLVWHLPNNSGDTSDVRVVRSGTAQGDALLERFERDGVQSDLFEMGFTDVGEFWAPWCAVSWGDEVASLGFAARLGRFSAELGLVTAPRHRGRGFGAKATAAWASHPELATHTLFYSTASTNLSSQRVTERLGLRLIGRSWRLG
jgi:RimJ/RimL family protein N-acetyltransferase